ncbi:MAG: hypothetical protein D6722_17375 [Bacteroidetes bacterium]|nr:MAG: hypothetical protein D6722_17375 [Bacteroidota bacterium]
MFNLESHANWCGVYLVVPFLLIRLWLQYEGPHPPYDEFAASGQAFLGAVFLGLPSYLIVRNQLEVVKLIPLALMTLICVLALALG